MKLRFTILFFILSAVVYAQQTDRYTHEFIKPMIYNPAFTGSTDNLSAMLISRAQWISFRNSPQQNVFTLDGMLPGNKMGVGISLFSDKKGISRKTGGDLYYAYRLKLNDNAGLTFGVSLGLIDHSLSYAQAAIEDPSDPVIVGPSQRETSVTGNAGLRFNWKNLNIGVAAPQLTGNALTWQDNTYGTAYYALSRHYLASAGYSFYLSEEKGLSLTPQATVHFLPGAPLYYDTNLNFLWKDKFWIGATYKSEYAISANAGFCIAKRFSVGYAYDIIIGEIGNYSGMSHEIMLNFVFGKQEQQDKEPEAITSSADKEMLDSLKNELEIKDNRISSEQSKVSQRDQEIGKLKSENEELKKAALVQVPSAGTGKQEPPAGNNDKPLIKSAQKDEYTYVGTTTVAKKGYYVIVGTYFTRDFAEDQLKKLLSEGNSGAKILFSKAKEFNYVSVAYHSTKDAAVNTVSKMRSAGMAGTWILSIED